MAQGIYKLIFKNTNKVYIGQSIHIDKRFATHLNELKNGTHSIKLQEAYNLYGIPDLVILEEVLEENLDTAEERYIQLFNSVSNGFNSTHSASGGVSLGENNGRSKYSNTQIIEAVELMVEFPDISLKVLANTLNISWDTIREEQRQLLIDEMNNKNYIDLQPEEQQQQEEPQPQKEETQSEKEFNILNYKK